MFTTIIFPFLSFLSQILNFAYSFVSIRLNDYENHRTDTEYEDNLISKIFIFQLVNSFAALTYVSFIKYFLGIECVNNDCIGDSAASLSTIFIVRLVSSAVVNVFVRKVCTCCAMLCCAMLCYAMPCYAMPLHFFISLPFLVTVLSYFSLSFFLTSFVFLTTSTLVMLIISPSYLMFFILTLPTSLSTCPSRSTSTATATATANTCCPCT